MTDNHSRQWFVLSASDGIKNLEGQFKSLSASRVSDGGEPVEYFLPVCVEATKLFGRPAMRRKKLIGNYIFIRDTYKNIVAARQVVPSLRFLPHPDHNQGEKRYMTVSDRDMHIFKAVARAYANELPCFPVGAVDLDEGDRIEVVGGEFDGMKGTLQCSQGLNGGKVLMEIGNLFLVASPNIGPQYIRILQFGKGNRHPYRQFEAHLNRAIVALKHRRQGNGDLTNEDIAAMTVFTGRFEALKSATVNIASQHATLMLMSYAALQDQAKAGKWLVRCQEILPKVKSDTQRAWQLVFMYAATGDDTWQRQAHAIVDTWPATTLSPSDRKRTLIITTLTKSVSQ